MRAVLYTPDFEPITALSLSAWVVDMLERHGSVKLAIQEPMLALPDPLPILRPTGFRSVTITAERLVVRGRHHLLLFTNDDESALLLKSVFLPGQRRALREAEDDALAKGITRGMEAAFKLLRDYGE